MICDFDQSQGEPLTSLKYLPLAPFQERGVGGVEGCLVIIFVLNVS